MQATSTGETETASEDAAKPDHYMRMDKVSGKKKEPEYVNRNPGAVGQPRSPRQPRPRPRNREEYNKAFEQDEDGTGEDEGDYVPPHHLNPPSAIGHKVRPPYVNQPNPNSTAADSQCNPDAPPPPPHATPSKPHDYVNTPRGSTRVLKEPATAQVEESNREQIRDIDCSETQDQTDSPSSSDHDNDDSDKPDYVNTSDWTKEIAAAPAVKSADSAQDRDADEAPPSPREQETQNNGKADSQGSVQNGKHGFDNRAYENTEPGPNRRVGKFGKAVRNAKREATRAANNKELTDTSDQQNVPEVGHENAQNLRQKGIGRNDHNPDYVNSQEWTQQGITAASQSAAELIAEEAEDSDDDEKRDYENNLLAVSRPGNSVVLNQTKQAQSIRDVAGTDQEAAAASANLPTRPALDIRDPQEQSGVVARRKRPPVPPNKPHTKPRRSSDVEFKDITRYPNMAVQRDPDGSRKEFQQNRTSQPPVRVHGVHGAAAGRVKKKPQPPRPGVTNSVFQPAKAMNAQPEKDTSETHVYEPVETDEAIYGDTEVVPGAQVFGPICAHDVNNNSPNQEAKLLMHKSPVKRDSDSDDVYEDTVVPPVHGVRPPNTTNAATELTEETEYSDVADPLNSDPVMGHQGIKMLKSVLGLGPPVKDATDQDDDHYEEIEPSPVKAKSSTLPVEPKPPPVPEKEKPSKLSKLRQLGRAATQVRPTPAPRRTAPQREGHDASASQVSCSTPNLSPPARVLLGVSDQQKHEVEAIGPELAAILKRRKQKSEPN